MLRKIQYNFSLFIFTILCAAGLSFIPGQLQAQNKTWDGETDANWHNPNNWDPYGVPSNNADITVQSSGGNPFPVISEEDVTVESLQISNWSGGELTVSNGQTITITNGLTFNGGGSLFIESDGAVHLTGGSFSMAYNNTLIDMESGSFTSEIDIEVNGDGFNAGTGTVHINANFILPSSKVFNVESATVSIYNTTQINGTYNGDDGNTTFNSNVEVQSGGVVNLDSGTITFNDEANIRNNGTLNMGSGTVNLNVGLTAESDGNVNVQDGELNVQGNADFQNNGNLSVDNGSVNVSGDASLQNGGSFDFDSGSMSVGGNATFQNGGTVNAGKSQIDLKGDMTVQSGGDFNADSSTVSFSGDQDQTINTDGNDITFHNVKVDSGSSIQTDGSAENTVTIENNLTVEEDGQVNVQDDDNIDIQGDLDDQGNVKSKKPFIYAISTPSLTEVLVTFDKEMDANSAGQASNYSINNGISVSNAIFSSSDPTKVLLEVSTLAENTEYELVLNNIESADGAEISQDHLKRFTPKVDITYYSRQAGEWDAPSSWSVESHTGSAASEIPNAQDDEDVVIGNNHTISLGSTQNISNLNKLTIDNTGTLSVSAGDTLILKQFTVIGSGVFDLQSGGTINIGSPDGITSGNTSKGNIQTTGSRNYSSSANYIYSGSSTQKTGSGLPQNVNDFRVDNTSGVTASSNLQVNGTLYLQNGSLAIPSGQALIANNKSTENGNLVFERILSGEPGWWMISSPIATDYANFLDGILTQGYDGASYDANVSPHDTLQPNVMYYDESHEGTDNQRWRAPASSDASVPAGLGYNVYLFGDVVDDNRYNNPLPDTLSVEGQENSGSGSSINLNVTYTAEADTGWNLVGNPYGAPIDWDDIANWTKTNIDQTIYVWDPDTESYKTWNGTTGSLGNGLIAPFQSFWIKANAPNPELSVSENAKTFGDNFVGKIADNQHPEIEIQLIHQGKSSNLYFSFSENAKVGKDHQDAYYLEPPPGTENYLELYSIGRNHTHFSINSLPLNFGVPIEIPISANILNKNEKVSSSVDLHIATLRNIPSSWEVTLIDRKTGQELTPSQGSNFKFKSSGQAPSTISRQDTANVLKEAYHILADSDPSEARFALRIDPGFAGTGLPDEINLKQNYPNPFNPSTTIRFTLPIQNEVTLEIYNILGRKVATLLRNESFQAGLHKVSWDASNIASGTYIYRLVTDQRVISKKMTVIK